MKKNNAIEPRLLKKPLECVHKKCAMMLKAGIEPEKTKEEGKSMNYHVKITLHFTSDDVKNESEAITREGFSTYATIQSEFWKTYNVESPEKALHDCMKDFLESHMEYYTYGKPITFEIANDEYDEIMKKKQEEENRFSDFISNIFQ